MKKLLTILSFFACAITIAQVPAQHFVYLYGDSATYAGKRDTLFRPTRAGAIVNYSGIFYGWDGTKWISFASGSTIIPGGTFTTSNVGIGYNPGTNLTVQEFVNSIWYGLKPPTATLSGGTLLEYTGASTVNQTLNWGAGRQSNTATLSTIVVAGTSETFSQPAQGATVTGTQAVSVPANVSTTYTNLVTASDGQTASATTQYTFAPRKYYGWISDTTGIASGSQDAAILALTSALSTSKTLTTNTGAPGGTRFFVYAYASSLGSISNISFNGIPADEAMTTVSKSLTTANTFTGTYTIIYNKQGQTTSSDVIFQ